MHRSPLPRPTASAGGSALLLGRCSSFPRNVAVDMQHWITNRLESRQNQCPWACGASPAGWLTRHFNFPFLLSFGDLQLQSANATAVLGGGVQAGVDGPGRPTGDEGDRRAICASLLLPQQYCLPALCPNVLCPVCYFSHKGVSPPKLGNRFLFCDHPLYNNKDCQLSCAPSPQTWVDLLQRKYLEMMVGMQSTRERGRK